MKSTVDAKAFARALDRLRGLIKPAPLPCLENVCVTFGDGKCVLSASDLTVWMQTELPACGDSFRFVFSDTKSVMKACRFFSGELTLELTGEEKSLQLVMSCRDKSGKSSVESTEGWPQQPTPEYTHHYTVNAETLLSRVKRIKYASTVIEQRPVLSGVRFQDSRLWCVDGCRIALSESDDLTVEEPFILPAYGLAQLASFGKSDVTLAVGKKYACFAENGTKLLLRRMEQADSLSLDTTFPKEHRERYEVDRRKYLDALKYLSEFLGKTPKTYIRFANGILSLKLPSSEYSVSLELDARCEVEYGFNLRHMKEALEQFPGEERLVVSASSRVSPIVLTDGKGGSALVLPVRMKEDMSRRAA